MAFLTSRQVTPRLCRKDLDSSEPSWRMWFSQWPVSHLPPPSFLEDKVLGSGARSSFRRCSPPDHRPDPPSTLNSSHLRRHTFLYVLFLGLEAAPWPFLGRSHEAECHLLEKSQTKEWALDPDSWPCGEPSRGFLNHSLSLLPAKVSRGPWPCRGVEIR